MSAGDGTNKTLALFRIVRREFFSREAYTVVETTYPEQLKVYGWDGSRVCDISRDICGAGGPTAQRNRWRRIPSSRSRPVASRWCQYGSRGFSHRSFSINATPAKKAWQDCQRGKYFAIRLNGLNRLFLLSSALVVLRVCSVTACSSKVFVLEQLEQLAQQMLEEAESPVRSCGIC